jgi:hypothetical protein
VNTCVNCLSDYPEDETFWVDYAQPLPIGYYCYECDANLIVGEDDEEDEA